MVGERLAICRVAASGAEKQIHPRNFFRIKGEIFRPHHDRCRPDSARDLFQIAPQFFRQFRVIDNGRRPGQPYDVATGAECRRRAHRDFFDPPASQNPRLLVQRPHRAQQLGGFRYDIGRAARVE